MTTAQIKQHHQKPGQTGEKVPALERLVTAGRQKSGSILRNLGSIAVLAFMGTGFYTFIRCGDVLCRELALSSLIIGMTLMIKVIGGANRIDSIRD